MRVTWPDGQVEQFGALEHGGQYRLVQGSGRAVRVAPRKEVLRIAASEQTLPPKQPEATLRPLTPLSFPPLKYKTLSGEAKQLLPGKNKPLLVNLWASWCQPCLEELVAFSKQTVALQDAGLEVVALNVDGLGDDATPAEEAAKFTNRLQLPFTIGRADATLLDQLQQLHDMQTTLRPPLPLPTSFLIDREGRLIAIYKGPVAVETVLEELKDAETHSDHQGNFHRAAGKYPAAIKQFNRAIELLPGEPGSYNNLAWLRATCADGKYRDATQAITLARKACQLTGWNDFSTLDTLATAYAADEDWKQAASWQEKALEFSPPAQRADLQRRLDMFRKENTSANPSGS